ncbi:MAG: hypothetical protein GXO78_03280 [Calditrichaeota bacterium]|nr:hypothetical protein [Calditrichota bacterium]
MWFKKKTSEHQPPFPGIPDALDGHRAVWKVEEAAAEAMQVHAIPNTARLGQHRRSVADSPRVLVFRSTADSRILSGITVGTALVGLRSVAFTSGTGPAEMRASLDAAVGKRLSFVIHLTSRAPGEQADSLLPGHADYHALSESGLFQLFAKNVQEAADFALIAHRLAELALNPGLVAQDSYLTSHSVQPLRMPEPELIARFLGDPSDQIECPTPAQKQIFGEKRRRIPEWFDLDRPLGLGTVQDRESFFRAVAARRPYFWQHVAPLADQVFQEFAQLTGRHYQRVQAYRLDDADYVLVAQGSLVEDLEMLADALRKQRKLKVGVLNITMFRPFPGEHISHLLKGKKAVTVFERVDPALAEDPPLLRDIRAAVDRALENGARGNGPLPYPEYAVYEKLSDRPRFFSAIYGIGGGNPSPEELQAAVENMLPTGESRQLFYLGVAFRQEEVRFPILEQVQQRLDRDYPRRDQLGLLPKRGDTTGATLLPRQTFRFLAVSGTGGTMAGNILARSLYHVLNWALRTIPEYHLHQALPYTDYRLERFLNDSEARQQSTGLQALVVQDVAILSSLEQLGTPVRGGILILNWEDAAPEVWFQLPDRIRREIQQRELRLFVLNARQIARQVGSDSHFESPLINHALMGAMLKVCPSWDASEVSRLLDAYRKGLEEQLESSPSLVQEAFQALQKGMEQVSPLDWSTLPPVEEVRIGEPPAPWTVRETRQFDQSIFDLTHFWETVGYFYETRRPAQTLITPALATGAMPARSSAFRDFSPSRKKLPRLIPENCTACGLCWTLCPESALPGTVQQLADIVRVGLQQAESRGTPLMQLQRVGDNLAKLAYRIFQKDELHQHLTLGELFRDAFQQLLEIMKPNESLKTELEQDFDRFVQAIQDVPIVRTETFFDRVHQEQKGNGLIFTLAVNPDACKSCNLCVAVCPEEALEMMEQTDRDVAMHRRNWEFLMALPDVPLERLHALIREEAPETHVYALLNRKVYHAMLGGDNAPPASGIKIGMRLVAAAAEAVLQPHLQQLLSRIREMIQQLEARVQGQVSQSLKINDFEAFARKLSGLETRKLDLDTLMELLREEGESPVTIDRKWLEQLTRMVTALKELRDVYEKGATGDGRARLAMAVDSGSVAFWSGIYPYNPFPFPWVHQRYGEAPALAEGLLTGLTRKMLETFRLLRKARWILDDTYDPKTHDRELAALDWDRLTEEEKALVPPLVVVGDDGALGEAGLAGLSRLLQGQFPVKIVVFDSQGYVATGGQPGAGSFASQWQEPQFRKQELALMALAFRQAFVMQASIGYPGPLLRDLQRMLQYSGPALAVIYTPEPHAHGLLPEKVLEQARRAVQTRTVPLWTYDPSVPGEFQARLDLSANPEPEQDWVTVREWGRTGEKHYQEITHPVTFAHWAVHEARFRHQFQYRPQKEWHREMVPLVDYLNMAPEDREGLEPYIEVVDEKDRLLRVVVRPAIVLDTEDRLRYWHLLQELAGLRSSLVERIRQEARDEMERQLQEKQEALEKAYQQRKQELEQQHEQIYHARLTRRLLELSGYGQNAEKLKQTLKAFAERARGNGKKESEPSHE